VASLPVRPDPFNKNTTLHCRTVLVLYNCTGTVDPRYRRLKYKVILMWIYLYMIVKTFTVRNEERDDKSL